MLLEEDARCGYRLKPNLDLPAGDLGFSLKSNSIGLRGPCDPEAGNVIFGTSYAMGIAVNNGENWHELCLPEKDWLNLGLAVGIREWGELLAMHHRGPKKRAILLYHPNIWVHCLMYERWRDSGRSVFEALHWQTNWLSCAVLRLRKDLSRQKALRAGNWLRIPVDGSCYQVDTHYALVPEAEMPAVFQRNISELEALMAGFENVSVIRLPTRQELVPQALRTASLDRLLAQYDVLWEMTVATLTARPSVKAYNLPNMQLYHYHPSDSHWNQAGNKFFADWIRRLID